MLLGEWISDRGLSNEDVAARLNEQGVAIRQKGSGEPRPVTVADVADRRGRTATRSWAKALGIQVSSTPSLGSVVDERGATPDAPGDTEAPSGRRERAPRRPAEAKVTLEAPGPGAKKRIAGAYRLLGGALAAGSGSEGVAVVWNDQADPIADLWLQAAEESPWAARFVTMMQAGGVTGDLAAAHLYLAGASLYVLGAAIPGGDGIFAKYSRHRRLPPAPVAAERNGHDGESAAEAAAAGSVADGQ